MDAPLDIRDYLIADRSSPTGLRWIKSHGRGRGGSPTSTKTNSTGRYVVCFDGRRFKAHRVVFYLTHGRWPAMIDHIDGNPLNNAADNLREITNAENQHNQRCAKGYTFDRGAYKVAIKVGGQDIYIGRFRTEAEARAAYLGAKKIYHPSTPLDYYE